MSTRDMASEIRKQEREDREAKWRIVESILTRAERDEQIFSFERVASRVEVRVLLSVDPRVVIHALYNLKQAWVIAAILNNDNV